MVIPVPRSPEPAKAVQAWRPAEDEISRPQAKLVPQAESECRALKTVSAGLRRAGLRSGSKASGRLQSIANIIGSDLEKPLSVAKDAVLAKSDAGTGTSIRARLRGSKDVSALAKFDAGAKEPGCEKDFRGKVLPR